MKKIKRIINNLINNIKSIRISTIYKIIGVLLLIGIIVWIIMTWQKSNNLENSVESTTVESNTNINNNYKNIEDTEKKEQIFNENTTNNIKTDNHITENIKEENTEENKNEVTISPKTINNYREEETKATETDVINFFTEASNELDDKNLKEAAKEKFITIVDFLFYDGKIKGYTFNELTTKAKLQVLKIALYIDNKIENYFPEYKESISRTTGKIYTGIKNKIIENYLNLTAKVCNKDKELCNSAKDDFQQMKKSFSLTWKFLKNLIKDNTDKLKDWYEIYSGKKE